MSHLTKLIHMIQFNQLPALITPAHSNLIVEVEDTARKNQTGLQYEIVITVQGETRSFRMLPNAAKVASVNISKVLAQFLDSSIHLPNGGLSTAPDALLSYTIIGRSYIGASVLSLTSSTKYVFNGVDSAYDFNDYILKANNNAKPLNVWKGSRLALLTDTASVSFLQGTFATHTSQLANLNVRVTSNTGVQVVSSTTFAPSATPRIVTLNLSPSYLNTITGVVIDSNTSFYEVYGNNDVIAPIRVDVVESDARFKDKYRIAYVDSHGATEYIPLCLASTNTVALKRFEYKSNDTIHSYGTQVLDTYSNSTPWMDEVQSASLKDLWYSPKVADVTLNTIKPIILTSKKHNILNRRNASLISYKVQFKYAKDFITQ